MKKTKDKESIGKYIDNLWNNLFYYEIILLVFVGVIVLWGFLSLLSEDDNLCVLSNSKLDNYCRNLGGNVSLIYIRGETLCEVKMYCDMDKMKHHNATYKILE